MKSLEFYLPTKLLIGNGYFKNSGQYLRESVKGNKVFIVTDPGIEKVGFVQELLQILNAMKLTFLME